MCAAAKHQPGAAAPRLKSIQPCHSFAVHFLNTEETAEARAKRNAYLDPVRAILQPRHEAFFAGRIDPSGMSAGDWVATKLVGSPSGDRRDWPAVRAWADGLFA